jgi:CRP-like cAMP-binding protein
MPPSKRWPQTLRPLELFADCTDAELDKVSSLVTGVHLKAGQVLMREGRFGFEFIVIARGEAGVSVQGGAGDGTERQVAVVGPGDFVGEMSLLGGVPRNATVTALSPLVVYVSNLGEFSALMAAAPSVAEKILRRAAERAA